MNPDLTLLQPDCTNIPVVLADYIYPAIQKQYVTILTLEARILADEDPAAVHRLRVSLRRLRSQIQAFDSILDIPTVMGEKHIGKIAKVLGKVRDLDVLQDICENHQLNLPEAEQLSFEKVSSAIAKRRRKEILKVKLMMNSQDYQYFKLGVNNWLNYPQYLPIAHVEVRLILPDLLLQSIGKLLINSSWWLDLDLDSGIDSELAVSQLLLIHGETLHDFRKQVKATRYLMEIFVDRYPPQYTDYLKDFKQIHQLFGKIQDSLVLSKFIYKILGKRGLAKLPTLSAEITRNNQLNWDNWQPIQDRYRQSQVRQEFQLFLIQDIIKLVDS